MKKFRKHIAIFNLIMVMAMFLGSFNVLAAVYSVPQTGEVVIPAVDYKSKGLFDTTNGVIKDNVGDCLNLAFGDKFSYDITFPADGLYNFTIDASERTAKTIQVFVDGIRITPGSAIPAVGTTYLPTVRQSYMNLRISQGTHEVEFRITGGAFYLKSVIISQYAAKILPEGDNFISNVNYYSKAASVTSENGNLVFSGPIEYRVNVMEAGYYKLSVRMGVTAVRTVNAYYDGNLIGSGNTTSTGALLTYMDFYISQGYLSQGVHIIKVSGGSGYLNGLTLSQTDFNWSKTYSALTDYSAKSSSVTLESPHMKFNGWLDFTVNVPQEGYYLIYSDIGISRETLTVISVNGQEVCSSIPYHNVYSEIKRFLIGRVKLNAGANTVRIDNKEPGGYIDSIFIKALDMQTMDKSTADTLAVDYNTGGQNVAYYDTTPGTGIEYSSDYQAVEITAGEWFKYDINVQKSGLYTIMLNLGGEKAVKNIELSTGNGNTIAKTIRGTTSTLEGLGTNYRYLSTTIGDIFLSQGTNTLKVSCTSGSMYLKAIEIYEPKITFYQTRVKASNQITSLASGKIIAKAQLNSAFLDKNMTYAWVIYKTSSSGAKMLDRILYNTVNITLENDVLFPTLDTVSFVPDTGYESKLLLWDNNMKGNYYVLSE